jgi:hypothetical protein
MRPPLPFCAAGMVETGCGDVSMFDPGFSTVLALPFTPGLATVVAPAIIDVV